MVEIEIKGESSLRCVLLIWVSDTCFFQIHKPFLLEKVIINTVICRYVENERSHTEHFDAGNDSDGRIGH